jgi:hypothetical protein
VATLPTTIDFGGNGTCYLGSDGTDFEITAGSTTVFGALNLDIGAGVVDTAEFAALDGVTSNVQTQLDTLASQVSPPLCTQCGVRGVVLFQFSPHSFPHRSPLFKPPRVVSTPSALLGATRFCKPVEQPRLSISNPGPHGTATRCGMRTARQQVGLHLPNPLG